MTGLLPGVDMYILTAWPNMIKTHENSIRMRSNRTTHSPQPLSGLQLYSDAIVVLWLWLMVFDQLLGFLVLQRIGVENEIVTNVRVVPIWADYPNWT